MDKVTIGIGVVLLVALLLLGQLLTFGPIEIALYTALLLVATVVYVGWARRRHSPG